ncbi:PilT protein domain protein [Nitrosococcus halophilus Nc 4]|uniref:PilT protein domain protein n=1 Tax=Nitrosococcus halophilus (strain Nc4) TaxID=472759 RepID=D5C4E5_NITHN|nr:PIN domain-containing protein [Nitrosococcus halophilus]ADE15129.1 PilT protein domain protein [Nitrosococcus halophilus Nc 4]
MASLIYLDTHVAAWLYAQGRDAVPHQVAHLIEETDDIRISPMVRLELQYLFEIGRVKQPPLPVLDALESTLGLVVCKAAFPAIVREAESQIWTRDPFDRLIVAQATLFGAPLVTKDATIHANYTRAIWD